MSLLLLFPLNSSAEDYTLDGACVWAAYFDETSGDLIDQCGSNDGTLVNTPTQGVPGKFGTAYNFIRSGGDEHIAMGDVTFYDGIDTVSWGWWMKTATDWSSYTAVEIIRKDGTANIQANHKSDLNRMIGWTTSRLDHNVSTANYPTAGYWFHQDDAWHHYWYTYDGAKRKAYRDCTQVGSDLNDTGNFANSANGFYICSDAAGKSCDDVDVDDTIIFNTAKSLTVCNDLMDNGITPVAPASRRRMFIQ